MTATERQSLLETYAAYSELKKHGPWKWISLRAWQHPCLAPIVFTGRLDAHHLNEASRLHAKLRPKKSRTPGPYVTFFTRPSVRKLVLPAMSSLPAGWQMETEYLVQFWNRPISFQVPEKYTFVEGTSYDRKLLREFNEFQRRHGNWDKKFLKDWNELVRSVKSRTRFALIRHASGKTVAAGLVIIGEKGAVLMAGTVDPRYRRRGLWRALLGARQAIAARSGARKSLLFTKNKAISRQGEKVYRIHSLVQRSKSNR